MDAGPSLDCLAACGLPQAWADQAAWTLLDTDFQDGQVFLQTWLAWRRDPHRPRMLHYVGIAAAGPVLSLPSDLQKQGHLREVCLELAAQCQDMEHGFRRMIFDAGQVSLTLCLGEVHAVLSEHVFQADTVFALEPANKWAVQSLARRCKRGTRLCVHPPPSVSSHPSPESAGPVLMQDAGFQWDAGTAVSPLHYPLVGVFNPRWEISSSRSGHRKALPTPGRCAVVGAGISGASVAHALALRGWQVTVLDQDAAPASGASGLPVGLAVPHVSADDSPRSRLSRNGIHVVLQHAQRLLVRGQDWERSGVLECKKDGPPLWHPQAAWIKPGLLVKAWLTHPAITFVGLSKITSLERTNGLWKLCDAQQQEWGSFEMVVLANALGCATLLKGPNAPAFSRDPSAQDLQDKLAALQAIHGSLSHGTYAEQIPNLPDTPVNGNGCFLPHVPGDHGEQWLVGSTFETDAMAVADIGAQHAINMARLKKLLPDCGAELADTLDRGPVSHWSATRCVTHDRLPLVGPVDAKADSGLWLCVGMGSRGLSFAALCAEMLVARLGGEPLPVEFNLGRSLDLHRARRKRPTTAGHAGGNYTF